MDVVVTPSAGRRGRWQLEDRLGRKLGEITQARPDHFVIHPNPDGSLSRVSVGPYGRLMMRWTGSLARRTRSVSYRRRNEAAA